MLNIFCDVIRGVISFITFILLYVITFTFFMASKLGCCCCWYR